MKGGDWTQGRRGGQDMRGNRGGGGGRGAVSTFDCIHDHDGVVDGNHQQKVGNTALDVRKYCV